MLNTPFPKDYLRDTPATLLVPADTKKLWAVQLDLLAKIDSVCRKYEIRYSIDSGTLIGAVRHGGFIPWDDDIDVIMMRADYNRFSEVIHNEISGYYFFQTAENSPGYYRPFARLLNTNTTAIIRRDMVGDKPIWPYRQSVFVDIMIADNVPDSESEYAEHGRRLVRLLDSCRRKRTYSITWSWWPHQGWKAKLFRKALLGCGLKLLKCEGVDLVEHCYARFLKELKRYNEKPTVLVAPFTDRLYERLLADDFNHLIDVDFEYLKVKAFARYDEILTRQYGDWHRHVIAEKVPMYYQLKGAFIND